MKGEPTILGMYRNRVASSIQQQAKYSHANTGPAYPQKKMGFHVVDDFNTLVSRTIRGFAPTKQEYNFSITCKNEIYKTSVYNKEFGGVLQMIFHFIGQLQMEELFLILSPVDWICLVSHRLSKVSLTQHDAARHFTYKQEKRHLQVQCCFWA